MATEVIMPKVDMVMETGTLVEWCKQEGEQVIKGDTLFVISTDKAAIECEAPADGILSGITAHRDDVVPVSQVIAYILAPGETLPTKPVPEPEVIVAVPSAVAAATGTITTTVAEAVAAGKVRATPVARRMAENMGIDLHRITGCGPRGRIQKSDVLDFRAKQTTLKHPAIATDAPGYAAPAALVPPAPAATLAHAAAPVMPAGQPSTPVPAVQHPVIPLPDARRKQVVPLAGARKIIAERLSYSAASAPHINLSLRVDMTEAIRLREQLLEPIQKRTGQRVSYTAIIARAVTSVLPQHPYLNASISDSSIILWDDIHLGIAASVDDSLIVPVIREAQSKNLGQIVSTLADLTDRARNRRLTPGEMTGSTFTISNLGMFGIETFTAIINPPEAAILAVGKMVDTPVRSSDGFVFRPMINLTVSADHRLVDGVAVARFLDDLKTALENPYLLI